MHCKAQVVPQVSYNTVIKSCYCQQCVAPFVSGVYFKNRNEAALAQLVEHRIRNAGVACSSHASGTKMFLRVIIWSGHVYSSQTCEVKQQQMDQIGRFFAEIYPLIPQSKYNRLTPLLKPFVVLHQ